jgi:hypothetical protein
MMQYPPEITLSAGIDAHLQYIREPCSGIIAGIAKICASQALVTVHTLGPSFKSRLNSEVTYRWITKGHTEKKGHIRHQYTGGIVRLNYLPITI